MWCEGGVGVVWRGGAGSVVVRGGEVWGEGEWCEWR